MTPASRSVRVVETWLTVPFLKALNLDSKIFRVVSRDLISGFSVLLFLDCVALKLTRLRAWTYQLSTPSSLTQCDVPGNETSGQTQAGRGSSYFKSGVRNRPCTFLLPFPLSSLLRSVDSRSFSDRVLDSCIDGLELGVIGEDRVQYRCDPWSWRVWVRSSDSRTRIRCEDMDGSGDRYHRL